MEMKEEKRLWLEKILDLFCNNKKISHHHCNFIISQLLLTSHPRSTLVLLDTGTPGASREIFSEDADDGTRTRNPSITNRVF